MDTPIETVDGLIEKLGGLAKTAALLGAGAPTSAQKWRETGNLPPKHYLRHKKALKAAGIAFADGLWFPEARTVQPAPSTEGASA